MDSVNSVHTLAAHGTFEADRGAEVDRGVAKTSGTGIGKVLDDEDNGSRHELSTSCRQRARGRCSEATRQQHGAGAARQGPMPAVQEQDHGAQHATRVVGVRRVHL